MCMRIDGWATKCLLRDASPLRCWMRVPRFDAGSTCFNGPASLSTWLSACLNVFFSAPFTSLNFRLGCFTDPPLFRKSQRNFQLIRYVTLWTVELSCDPLLYLKEPVNVGSSMYCDNVSLTSFSL